MNQQKNCRDNSFRRYLSLAILGMISLGLLGGLIAETLNTAEARPLSQAPETPAKPMQKPQSFVDSKLVNGNTKFGFKLFSEIAQQDVNKNIFVSPMSVAVALAMTYNGASGETQQAMAKTLELQGLSLQDVNQSNEALRTVLMNADPSVQLSIANSLWVDQKVDLKPEFLQRNQQFYQAKVTDLDFKSPNAPAMINSWVKENTKGKINQIVDKIDPNQVLFLLNAIYFKGSWATKFDATQTANKPFYLANGTQKQHPMMSQRGKYLYSENEQFQAVALPYGKGRFSFYIFLPKQNSTLRAFQQQLNPENWETWMTQFRRREGAIQLPRFKMEYDIELTNALKGLGMDIAFSSRADFAQMSTADVEISEVKHKTFVEVNEEGTEAAAVTSVAIAQTSVQMPQEPFRMIVDRPFFSCIRDNQTGTLLFMGSIVEPK